MPNLPWDTIVPLLITYILVSILIGVLIGRRLRSTPPLLLPEPGVAARETETRFPYVNGDPHLLNSRAD